MSTWRPTPWQTVAAAFGFGCVLRWAGLGYVTPDATDFLLPWYGYAHTRGGSALGDDFTNYTPAFSYLLLLATLGDGLAPPLTLIKIVALPFELGCAVVAATIAWTLDRRSEAAMVAFSAVWLAPSVVHNGAWWGQTEALWTFFVLLAILAFLRRRPESGVLAFGAALSVKLQAVFLGPLVLGLVLRRRVSPLWLAAVPAVYLLFAAPTLLAGRPLADVLTIYLGQANTYRWLSVNAANLYLFVPNSLYASATLAGLVFAALVGLVLAVWIGRAPRLSSEALLIAACVTLLAMPFCLPKMHDRYMYAFEVAVLILASIRPAFWPMALLSQVDSALAYMPFDGLGVFGLPIAALTNGAILATLLVCLRAALDGRTDYAGTLAHFRLVVSALWIAYGAQACLLIGLGRRVDNDPLWPLRFAEPQNTIIFAAFFAAALLIGSRGGRRGAEALPEAT